jgi:hypothetical protein
MKLDDTQPCPGRWRPMKMAHAGICIACERFKPRTQDVLAIHPPARLGLNGEWVCDERRSVGVKVPA